MPEFRPRCHDTLDVAGVRYQFMPHPLFPGDDEMPYAIESGEALIFQLRSTTDGSLYALKAPKAAWRTPAHAQVADLLAPLAALPGFAAARRVCFTPATHAPLLARHPALTYAALMPWVGGMSWASVVRQRADPNFADLLCCATATAQALSQLEARGMAHSDVAGSNVLLDLAAQRVELVDFERLYAPTLPTPRHTLRGTPGYQHRQARHAGQWRATGDRFAAAVLLTEMLVWGDPLVRAFVPEDAENLFLAAEVGVIGTPLWRAVRQSLASHWPEAWDLFATAWNADTLDDCPEVRVWAHTLQQYMTRAGLTLAGSSGVEYGTRREVGS